WIRPGENSAKGQHAGRRGDADSLWGLDAARPNHDRWIDAKSIDNGPQRLQSRIGRAGNIDLDGRQERLIGLQERVQLARTNRSLPDASQSPASVALRIATDLRIDARITVDD